MAGHTSTQLPQPVQSRGYLHGEAVSLEGCLAFRAPDSLGSLCQLLLGGEERTDGCVRADIRTLVALDTFLGIPLGNIDCDTAFLKCGRTCGYGAVGMFAGEGADGNLVSVLGVDHVGHAAYPLGCEAVEVGRTEAGHYVAPLSGNGELFVLGSAVHCSVVHADHFLALLAVALVDGFLHEGHCLLVGDDAGNLEECGLEDGVGAVAQTDLLGYLGGVDDVDFQTFLGDDLLYMVGNPLESLFHRPEAVEQECTASLDAFEHIVFIKV